MRQGTTSWQSLPIFPTGKTLRYRLPLFLTLLSSGKLAFSVWILESLFPLLSRSDMVVTPWTCHRRWQQCDTRLASRPTHYLTTPFFFLWSLFSFSLFLCDRGGGLVHRLPDGDPVRYRLATFSLGSHSGPSFLTPSGIHYPSPSQVANPPLIRLSRSTAIFVPRPRTTLKGTFMGCALAVGDALSQAKKVDWGIEFVMGFGSQSITPA